MKKLFYLATLLSVVSLNTVIAQEETTSSEFSVSADLFNRYVWRGLDYGSAPSIQPTFEYAHKSGFTAGCWGAFSVTGSYNEVDLYMSYSLGNFDILITDYFFPVSGIPSARSQQYLNYNNETTGHGFEGAIKWNGTDKFPLTILAGTFLYGADKNIDGDQNYSTYIEALYEFDTKAGRIDAFMGFTPAEGLYGNTLGVVNMGLTTYRDLKITEHFTLPLQASFIVNPQISNVYLLLGFSF